MLLPYTRSADFNVLKSISSALKSMFSETKVNADSSMLKIKISTGQKTNLHLFDNFSNIKGSPVIQIFRLTFPPPLFETPCLSSIVIVSFGLPAGSHCCRKWFDTSSGI